MEESVLFNYWVVEAICRMGYVTEGIDYMKKHYAHMLKEGENGTLWEFANLYAQNKGQRYTGATDKFEGRSWCTAQGENGFPGISISHWILGLQPTTPGIEEIEIASLFSPYKEFSGVLPTPHGLLTVKREENRLILNIPKGITAKIKYSKLKKSKAKAILLDKKKHLLSELKDDLIIQHGQHTIHIVY